VAKLASRHLPLSRLWVTRSSIERLGPSRLLSSQCSLWPQPTGTACVFVSVVAFAHGRDRIRTARTSHRSSSGPRILMSKHASHARSRQYPRDRIRTARTSLRSSSGPRILVSKHASHARSRQYARDRIRTTRRRARSAVRVFSTSNPSCSFTANCSLRSQFIFSARDRIRTGGPLRDSVLSAAPLAWLGYPRSSHCFTTTTKNASLLTSVYYPLQPMEGRVPRQ
jgi:hypothetical protein